MPSEELTTTLKLRRPRFSQAWHGGRFLAGGEIAGLKCFRHCEAGINNFLLLFIFTCHKGHPVPRYFIL